MTDSSFGLPQSTAAEGRNAPSARCDGAALHQALAAGLAWLENHAEAINALNVFPVPDGDTGTNMVLTLRAAVAEASNGTMGEISDVLQAVARGALMGARGNSGVILSQLLRGMSIALQGVQELGARALAEAFVAARDMAYQGVMRPVEGTILTVAKEVASATSRAARNESMDVRQLLGVATDAARHAVAATPSLLPVLAEAGVVDAGGQGLFIILEGVYRHLCGLTVRANGELRRTVDLSTFATESEYGYDTQFIISGRQLDVEDIRAQLAGMGDSLLVVGDSTTVKVHIHTDRPGDPLNYAVTIGSVSDVVVENMQEQYQHFISERSREPELKPQKKVGIVAVAQGAGFRRVLESLGADVVVEGGQTMNPSVEELLEAVESLPNESVVILPNNTNVIMAAQQVLPMSRKRVALVPTRTVPQGIGALLAFNYELDLDENIETMTQSSREVQTIELTVATRAARVNGIRVKEGEYIALLNTDLVATGSNVVRVALRALREFDAEAYEIATIYRGRDTSEEDARQLSEAIAKRYPDLEIEVVDGGQPHYQFIVAVE
ncbi:MAG: DAK2 domain-containing protein [Anaerolineae bacterium]|nr:DAK2 domain-containing protein [Anaerolineae bacterium]